MSFVHNIKVLTVSLTIINISINPFDSFRGRMLDGYYLEHYKSNTSKKWHYKP